MTAAEQDFYGDLRPILDDDLAAFVREQDRHRSLTVVRDAADRDVIGEARRRVDRLRVDAAGEQPCTAMRTLIDRRATDSRRELPRAVIAVTRAGEQGHRGLAAALDELWQVLGSRHGERDFWRVVEWAQRRVVDSPSPPAAVGCRCTPEVTRPPTRAQVLGLLRRVLDAAPRERADLLAWATRRLQAHATAGHLDAEYVHNVIRQLRDAAEAGDPA